jgi:hypothetical protein
MFVLVGTMNRGMVSWTTYRRPVRADIYMMRARNVMRVKSYYFITLFDFDLKI